MLKKVFVMLLCIVFAVSVFTGCETSNQTGSILPGEDEGEYFVTGYESEQSEGSSEGQADLFLCESLEDLSNELRLGMGNQVELAKAISTYQDHIKLWVRYSIEKADSGNEQQYKMLTYKIIDQKTGEELGALDAAALKAKYDLFDPQGFGEITDIDYVKYIESVEDIKGIRLASFAENKVYKVKATDEDTVMLINDTGANLLVYSEGDYFHDENVYAVCGKMIGGDANLVELESSDATNYIMFKKAGAKELLENKSMIDELFALSGCKAGEKAEISMKGFVHNDTDKALKLTDEEGNETVIPAGEVYGIGWSRTGEYAVSEA